MVMEVVNVHYQTQLAGAVSFNTDTGIGAFEYTPAFIQQGIELAPLKMPLSSRIYQFPELAFHSFKGLPGLIADSLPDDFGNAVLNAWVAAQGRSPQDITPVQRLQYIGKRGMGALEYSPATQMQHLNATEKIAIDALIDITQSIVNAREGFTVELAKGQENKEAMLSLLSVGTSAGGARAKAVLAFNKDFTQVRSGQASVPAGFRHFLMKFDGISEHNPHKETFGDPLGFGAMEYVYYQMAQRCGIEMMPCYLLEEGKRRHFITGRFDRQGNDKVHVQTLNAMAHIDYKQPGGFSYAELFDVARALKLPATAAKQLFKRMVFNIIARNCDDHSKNTAFMLEGKHWSLAPAYDIAYSYKPDSRWVSRHWMSLNGKRDHFTREDFYTLENTSVLFTRRYIDEVIDNTLEHVSCWRSLAQHEEVNPSLINEVESHLHLKI